MIGKIYQQSEMERVEGHYINYFTDLSKKI